MDRITARALDVLEGDVLIAQKKPALAVKPYEQALALTKSGPLMIKLHSAMKNSGKEKEADSRLHAWLKENPSDGPVRMYLADNYLQAKQHKAAIEQYQALLTQNPKNVAVLNNLAWVYQQEKDPRAMEYAEKAYQLAGENPAILDTFGWLLVEQGNTTRALPILQKAATLAPAARFGYGCSGPD